eukprot:754020-Hanusia_phi.AAC.2
MAKWAEHEVLKALKRTKEELAESRSLCKELREELKLLRQSVQASPVKVHTEASAEQLSFANLLCELDTRNLPKFQGELGM